MTCEEFRNQLNLSLDEKAVKPLSVQLQEHTKLCRECADYASFMISLHNELLLIPRAQPSQTLLTTLKSLDSGTVSDTPKLDWKPEIHRALLMFSLAIIMFLVNTFLGKLGLLIGYCILTLGFTVLMVNILKPFYIRGSLLIGRKT